MEGRVSAASRLKFCYLAYASNPKAERFLYRAIRHRRVARIIEFAMTSFTRSRRLIEVAQRYAPQGKVSFTAIDPFESAAVAPPGKDLASRSLIGVFRALRPTGASVRLIPGELGDVLKDAANTLAGTDLLLIGHTVSDSDLARAWFYLPRMLHDGSLVVRERAVPGQRQVQFDTVPLPQIQSLAAHRHRPAA
jgi:hypothetical protein